MNPEDQETFEDLILLMQMGRVIPLIRKQDITWIHVEHATDEQILCSLTEDELRRFTAWESE